MKDRVHVSASIVAYNWKSTLLYAAIQILEAASSHCNHDKLYVDIYKVTQELDIFSLCTVGDSTQNQTNQNDVNLSSVCCNNWWESNRFARKTAIFSRLVRCC